MLVSLFVKGRMGELGLGLRLGNGRYIWFGLVLMGIKEGGGGRRSAGAG